GQFHVILVTGSRTFDDEPRMRQVFEQILSRSQPSAGYEPLLISGACPTGADWMAERLFAEAGYMIHRMPADWTTHGRAAGFRRNEQMVRSAREMQDSGDLVDTIAFLDRCANPHCPQRPRRQLLPKIAGHFSHGTVHCRAAALDAGLRVLDVIR